MELFLAEDLEDRVFEYNKQLEIKYLSENDRRGFDECMGNAKILFIYKRCEEDSELYYQCLDR